MLKIGIMTMHRILNYGSFLQAYGLKSFLEEMGHHVEFVDYHVEKPLYIENQKNGNGSTKIRKAINSFSKGNSILDSIKYIFYKKNFAKKYFPILGITKDMNYYPKLDLLIIGSDEVFNCIQKNKNVGYSLDLFGRQHKAKRLISYAGSFGNTTLDKLIEFEKDEEIKHYLNQFDSISVRDSNSFNIVEKCIGIEPYIHVDPALIYKYLDKSDLIPTLSIKYRFMIVYAYSGRLTKIENKYVRQYADEKNLKILSIGGIQECADKFIGCSPFEVISYFRQADCIITDTFHGSVFSIITKSNFATIIRKSIGEEYGNEEKLSYLLSKFNLDDRTLSKITNIDEVLNKNIDYESVDKILENERNSAREYISNQIKILLEE